MLGIVHSKSSTKSSAFKAHVRRDDEDNVAWCARNLQLSPDRVQLLLVGQRTSAGFRVRVAQSHARHDMTPSHWSGAALIRRPSSGTASSTGTKPKKKLQVTQAVDGNLELVEVSLEPPRGFSESMQQNGLQAGTLESYRDPQLTPNIALIAIPIEYASVDSMIERFRSQRPSFDTLELVIRWLSFTWGVGASPNPLFEGYGVPSAVAVEMILGSAGYDLTPGLASRSSCPEAIWQSAKWWHEYHRRDGAQAVSATYHIGDRLLPESKTPARPEPPVDPTITPRSATPAKSKRTR